MPSIRGLSLKSALLSEAGLCHGFSTRAGSASERFEAFLEDAGIERSQLRQVHQVHGARAVHAQLLPSPPPEVSTEQADALVAVAPFAVAVRVADCVPILLADPSSGAVAAVHAGWRGLVAGVIAATAGELTTAAREPLSSDGRHAHDRASDGGGDARARGTWLAALGPSIGPCCFEVGAEVANAIAGATDASVVVRRDESPTGKAFVDLRVAARFALQAAGLTRTNIEDVGGCTKCDAEQFFSYRRDGANAGRLFGAIAARAPR